MKQGLKGELEGNTFMQATFIDRVLGTKGKGRLVLQYGSFYDYKDHQIRPNMSVDRMPAILTKLIDLLIQNGHLPKDARPNTAIINLYKTGDNIPPHIDHTDYPRPFSTLSLLSEAPMLFGVYMKPLGNGRFKAPFSVRCFFFFFSSTVL